MEFSKDEVATYLKWLNEVSSSPINILCPPIDGRGIRWGDTFPPLNDGAVDYLHGELAPMEDIGAVWASIHQLSDGAVGKTKVAISDVLSYRFLAIDLDNKPINGQRCSATDAELSAVRKVATDIECELVFKWRMTIPLIVCSGNGYLLLFPIALPNNADNRHMMGRLATALAKKYNSPNVDIDTDVVKDPSRVCGLTGTMMSVITSNAATNYRIKCRHLLA